jgi:Predicted unusual protein kinase
VVGGGDEENLPLELSFTEEGKNAEKISILLEKFSWLKIPEIHWDLTSDRVIVMEYCPGTYPNG